MKRGLITVIAALALAGTAQASSIQELATLGYSTKRVTGIEECKAYTTVGAKDSASGYGESADFGCVNGPGYDAAIDAFRAGHDERKLVFEHPAAAQARAAVVGKGYVVTVDYATAVFTVRGGCNVDVAVTAANLPSFAASVSVAAPCVEEAPAPAPAPAPEPLPTDPDDALTKLRSDLDALAKRVGALEEANVASWDAWVDAVQRGFSAYDAALAARSAGLNALYGLNG